MIHGPHCPKCGFSNCWVWYSGEDLNNPDALRCEAGTGIPGRQCGYIYWRRNAPASEVSAAVAAPEYRRAASLHSDEEIRAAAIEELARPKRARVRSLVHSMLVGNSYLIVSSRLNEKPAPEQVVLFAAELDSLIELIEAAPPSDAGVKPLRVPCSHKYTTGEHAVSSLTGECELCGNQVAQ